MLTLLHSILPGRIEELYKFGLKYEWSAVIFDTI